jgi:hypothetical protein
MDGAKKGIQRNVEELKKLREEIKSTRERVVDILFSREEEQSLKTEQVAGVASNLAYLLRTKDAIEIGEQEEKGQKGIESGFVPESVKLARDIHKSKNSKKSLNSGGATIVENMKTANVGVVNENYEAIKRSNYKEVDGFLRKSPNLGISFNMEQPKEGSTMLTPITDEVTGNAYTDPPFSISIEGKDQAETYKIINEINLGNLKECLKKKEIKLIRDNVEFELDTRQKLSMKGGKSTINRKEKQMLDEAEKFFGRMQQSMYDVKEISQSISL